MNKSIFILQIFIVVSLTALAAYGDSAIDTMYDEFGNTSIMNSDHNDSRNSQQTEIQFGYNSELEMYKGIVNIIILTVAIMAVVFGGLLAINLVTGYATVKEARLELKSIADSKEEQIKAFKKIKHETKEIVEKTIVIMQTEAEKTLDRVINREYEYTTVRKYKKEVLKEIEKDNPDLQKIYYRLTDLIKYPDQMGFRIYKICMEKFYDNRDIMKVIMLAMDAAADRFEIDESEMENITNISDLNN